jgi:beta-lactamase superfamily II metal-dependent hydrolase
MPPLRMHVLDVGQGASVILDFGRHRYGIVDCGGTTGGPDAAVVRFIKQARKASSSMRIAFLLITHLDLDHVKAIGSLLADRELGQRIERVYCNDLAYRKLLQALRGALTPQDGCASNPSNQSAMRALHYLGELIQQQAQRHRDFHHECVAPEGSDVERYPVRLRVPGLDEEFEINLWAPSQRLRNIATQSIGRPPLELRRAVFAGREIDTWNTASVVMTVGVAGRQILLAGDATHQTWEEILERAGSRWGGADVVVAWHHGGRLGFKKGVDYDALVWERVLTRAGKVVCISCGSRNHYGHPHAETLTAVRDQNGHVYCTQRHHRQRDLHRPVRTDDQHTMFLRTIAKSPLRIEHDDDQCCGNIVVDVGPLNELTVTCSTADCADRLTRAGCCLAARPLGADADTRSL